MCDFYIRSGPQYLGGWGSSPSPVPTNWFPDLKQVPADIVYPHWWTLHVAINPNRAKRCSPGRFQVGERVPGGRLEPTFVMVLCAGNSVSSTHLTQSTRSRCEDFKVVNWPLNIQILSLKALAWLKSLASVLLSWKKSWFEVYWRLQRDPAWCSG